MSKNKRIIRMMSLILAMVMCFCIAASATSVSDFTDVPGTAWYLPELEYSVAHSVINGTSATTFSPGDKMSRGQFIAILGRALNVTKTSGTKFSDVPSDQYYYGYVYWGYQNGIINGTSDSTFSPNDDLTREQMATMIGRAITNLNLQLPVENSSHSRFKDSSLVASYAVDAVETCWSAGILKGDTNGTVRPRDTVIRAEGMAIVARMVQKMTTSTEQTTTAAHTHNWVLQEGQMRETYRDGYRLYTCDCGETYTEVFPMGKDREGWVCAPENNNLHLVRKVEATAAENGYRLYTCDNCGYVIKTPIYFVAVDEYASYNSNVNYSEARRAGIAYAESLGFSINEDVNWNNSTYSGYTFSNQYASTEELIAAVKKDIDALYRETDSSELNITFYNCLIKEWTDPMYGENQTMIASAFR
jgi:hypothetical protein